MSVVRYEPPGGQRRQELGWHYLPTPSSTIYPTPKADLHSQALVIQHQRRYFSTDGNYSPPSPSTTTDTIIPVKAMPSPNINPAECVHPDQCFHDAPRVLEIVAPSGRKQAMIFVERISHITAQVEYGLVPADPRLRRYDEKGTLIGNEGMELLSPKVYEDTVPGTFFFAERRPPVPKARESTKGLKSRDRRMSGEAIESEGTASKLPTLLEQLVKLKVLKIIPTVRCRSIEHYCACLVRILLTDVELGHSCSSPRHRSCVLYEAPSFARFKVCTACRAVPYRRGKYYCSEACLAVDWPQHRIECGKTREQLQHVIAILPTLLHPRPPAPARLRAQTHRAPWYRAWTWMSDAAETNTTNAIDFKDWKANVKTRSSAGCKDLLPAF